MARGINKVIIVGNLGNDPDVKYSQSGTTITTISVATTEAWKDKQTGQQQERTEWHRVKFFGRLAEIAGEYLKKGRQVYIEGSLRTEKYTGKDGVERYITFDAQGLHSQRQGGRRFDLRYLGNDRFLFSHDVVDLSFQRSNGQVIGALFRSRDSEEQLTRIDKPLPKREAMALKNAELQAYVGEYELAPGFTLTFRADGDRFFVRATGQQEIEVFGSAPHEFFLTVVDANMTFHPEADGAVQRLTFRQGAEMEGKRVK